MKTMTFNQWKQAQEAQAEQWLEEHVDDLKGFGGEDASQSKTVREGVEVQAGEFEESISNRDALYLIALHEADQGFWEDSVHEPNAVEEAGIYNVLGIRGWSWPSLDDRKESNCAATATQTHGGLRHPTGRAGTAAAKLNHKTYTRQQRLSLKSRQFHCIEQVLTARGTVGKTKATDKRRLSNEERRARLAASVLARMA